MAKKTLGEHIREAREVAGLSQPELESLVGMTRGYLGYLERDEIGSPGVAIVSRIAKHLSVDLYTQGVWLRSCLERDKLPRVQKTRALQAKRRRSVR